MTQRNDTQRTSGVATAASREELQARVQELETELEKYRAAERTTQRRLERFDELDYVGYSQGIPRNDFHVFNDIHTEDVKVFNTGELQPVTTNIKDHDQAMLPLFAMFPDHQIREHPIAFGHSDWTCVMGVIEGTFSQAITRPDGKVVPPTNKPFQSTMVTLAKWRGERISEEYLFMSVDSIKKQVGLK